MLYRRVVLSYGRARTVHITLLILAVVVTIRLFSSRHSIYDVTEGKTSGPWRAEWSSPIKPPHSTANITRADGDLALYLVALARKHSLTSTIPFLARRVQARYTVGSHHPRPSLTDTKTPFLKTKPPLTFSHARVDHDDVDDLVLAALETPLVLPMGRSSSPREVDASALLFAVSTTYTRLVYADGALMHDWARWLTDGRGGSNGAGLVVALHGASEKQAKTIRDALRRLGVDVAVSASTAEGGDSGGRYAQLIQGMMRRRMGEGGSGREYFALVDDDVFFPCVGTLLKRLRQRYDPSGTYYIGVPSERSDWVVEDGRAVTYGGGAVFLTAGMLDMAGQLLCLQYTKTGGQSGEEGKSWDVLLYECIARNTVDVSLHVLPGGLYNPEQGTQGAAGLVGGYGSGILPLAMHRYRNYHRFEAGKGHLVASACGEACFLQRFLFSDNWVLVNGYTLTRYPGGVRALTDPKLLVTQNRDARTTLVGERLIIDADPDAGEADASMVMWKGRKKTWRLLDAKVRDNGEVWQAYVNRKGGDNAASGDFDDRRPGDLVHDDDEEKSDVDSVILLIWEPDK